MITPSISFDTQTVKPIWTGQSLEDVREMIRNDVAELCRYRKLQANAIAAGISDYQYRDYIKAWEQAQDAHWSWYREMQDAGSSAAVGTQVLGQEPVGSGN